MFSLKRGRIALTVLLSALLVLSAGILCSAHAAGTQLEVTSEPKTGESFTGLSDMARDGDVYLYNWRTDTARSWDLVIPAEAFTHGTLTLTVDLPANGGMAYRSNMLSELRSQSLVQSANIGGSGNTRLTVVFKEITDPSAALDFLLAVNTDTYQNIYAKALDAVENGAWPDTEMKFGISSSDGAVSSELVFGMRLEEGEEKEVTGSLKNIYKGWSSKDPLNYALQKPGYRDETTIVLPVYGYDSAELMFIDEIRIYIPGSSGKIYCSTWEKDGGAEIVDASTGIKFACDGVRYCDAKGKYYKLVPNYSSGTFSNVRVGVFKLALFKYWQVKDDLEPDTVYSAPDAEIVYRTMSGSRSVSVPGTGWSITTVPKETVDTWNVFTTGNDYRKPSPGRYTTSLPRGGSFTATFARFFNYSRLNGGLEQSAAVSGRTEESYIFPEEVRPTAFIAFAAAVYDLDINGAWGFGIESVSYTAVKEDGSSRTVTLRPNFDSKTADEARYELDFTQLLSEGERISSLTTVYSYIQGIGYSTDNANLNSRISYVISENADLGPVQIQYRASCAENNRGINYDENSAYFWINIIEPICPDIKIPAVRSSSTGYVYHSLDDTETATASSGMLLGNVLLGGVSGGLTSVTDPRIGLDIKLSKADSFLQAPSDPTIFLSGSMTLSKVMAGFTVEYSYTDGVDTYNRTYAIPSDLDSDFELTREMLGLGKGDMLLSFALKKDGVFDFSEAAIDNSYDYKLIGNVLAYFSSTDENGVYLRTKQVTDSRVLPGISLVGRFSHSEQDHCSKGSAHYAGTAAEASGDGYLTVFQAKGYTVSTEITGSVSTPVISQGGTMTSALNFDFRHDVRTGADRSQDNWGYYIDMGTTENIYIELADSQLEFDPSPQSFKNYLTTHGMDPGDVEIIELSDGRRFLHLSTGEALFYTPRIRAQNNNHYPVTRYVLTLTFRAWGGAAEGEHYPFGEVYYDLGDLAKYDGSPEMDDQYVIMNNTVTDGVTAELTGNAQRKLWKADLSALSVRITRATEVGSSMGMVVSGFFEQGSEVVFREDKADELTLSTTMTSPQGVPEVRNYTWTEKLPRKASGDEYDVFLTGPAYIHNNSLDIGSTVTYSYSVDGMNFAVESEVSDWSSIVYVRAHVDKTSEITSLETRYPVRAEKDSFGPPKTVRVTGDYSYEITGSPVQNGTMAPLTLIYEDSKYFIENYYQADGEYPQDPDETLERYGTAGETADPGPLAAPELRSGYIFDDTQQGNVTSGLIAASDDLVLRFYYKQQFTVSYVHGADSDQDESYCGLDWGALLPRYSGEPARSGWYFLGWNTEPDGSGVSPDDFALGQGTGPAQGGACVTEDLTFYARWTPNSSIVVPAAAAYKVEHWRQQPDGNYELYDTEFPLVGELGSTVDAAVRDLAAEHYLAEPNAQLSVLRGTVVMPLVSVGQEGQAVLETLVLKVYYDLDEHSLSYDANDASYPGAPAATGSMDALTRLHGNTVNVAGECGFTREGWVFAGWNTEADGSGDAAAAGSPVLLEEDITLYALWIPESSQIQPMAAAYKTEHWRQQPDESYELYETEFPLVGALGDTVDAAVRDYSDEHYLTEPNEALSVLSGVVVMPSVPAGAPAGSEPQILVLSVYYDLDMHSLSYDANDASYPSAPAAAGSMDAVIRLHGNTADAAYECGFEREGWVFTGWNTEADGSGDAVPGGTAVMLDEDVTLYARWIPKSSEIVPRAAVFRTEHYRQQPGGSYELYETEFPLVGELGSTVNASVKDYSGEHYLRTPNAELSKLSGVVVMPSVPAGAPAGSEPEILVLKVYYDLEEHCLSYDANDASYPSAPAATGSMPSVSARHGETVETAENGFSRTDWVFDGWTEDAEGRVPIRATSGAFILTEDVTFYAQWIPRSTPVTPQSAAYKVEHWRENADGKYELYETEFPLYAAIGESVSAAAKDYTADGYLAEPNAQRSIASGRVSMPETVIGSGGKEEVKILTLKLYYDRKPQPKPSYAPEKLETEKHFAYIEGYPDGSVRPEDAITRAEISTIFYRLLKDSVRSSLAGTACSFTDVEEGDWFYDAVAAMSELGIVNGYPDGSFRPSEKISRAELTAMAVRFDETEKAAKGNFYDVIGHWAQSDIAKAVENGWVNGYEDGSFKPDASITRAEAIALINRVLGRKLADEDGVIGGMIVATDNQDRGKWYWLDIQEAMNDHEYTMKSGGNEKWVKLIR
ncbi:MAG: S-layer homology domain-containing protein [Firmicutes bacterium]|nr:S-layer homology domain-containing protein [Bacillota bacterium]